MSDSETSMACQAWLPIARGKYVLEETARKPVMLEF